ncbi:putative receptor-like protein kinase At3g47110 [Quercus lobata]|uniref:putative receptor-like protein kinase At3g47110 n=1 Tax=Quercus lobata TaxID=97700 RepID=UPI001248447C|nr:putative receptor-like protein kinase At3g47110 [Quercus lobata]
MSSAPSSSSFYMHAFILVVLWCGLFVTSVVGGNNKTDRLVLLAFKAKIIDDPLQVPTNGVFKNTSATSIKGNIELCGGVPKFKLPICKYDKSKKMKLTHSLKLIIFTLSGIFGVTLWLHPISRTNEVLEEQKNLNLLQRLNIAIDVANALEYLHYHCHAPIVHCDLKPSNILLNDEMIGHVGDFGLARFLCEATQECFTNQSSTINLRGTIGYAPLEYGTGNEVSTYGDAYSYGILYLEMFTGKKPTDNIFKDNLNLHDFVKAALPERVINIVDPIILWEREDTETRTNDTFKIE